MALPALPWGSLVGVVLAGGGLLVVALAARHLRFAARVYRGDPVSVAQTANDPGPVEVEGVARPENGTVTAPFSGTACLVCEWEVQELRTNHAGKTTSTHWETLDEGLRGGPFRLEDDTASCLVQPAGSVRHFEAQSVTVPGGTTPPKRIREFIAENPDVDFQDGTIDLKIAELNLGNDQRYVERRLDVGEQCYVYGNAHYDPSAGSRGGEVNVRIDGEGVGRFVLSDGRERDVVWSEVKIGLGATLVGLLLVASGTVFLL